MEFDGNWLPRLGSGGSLDKFVAVNFCGDADATVIASLDAHYLALAAYVHAAGLCDLLRQRDDEFNAATEIKFCFGQKIEATIADVARLRFEFDAAGFVRKHTERKGHCEAPSFAAF